MRHPFRILLVVLAVLVVGRDRCGASPAEATQPAARQMRPTATPSPTAPTQASTQATRKPSPSARAEQLPARARHRRAEPRRKARPLRSITIALDPGHQLGNRRFPSETNALVPAGGFEKPCNTTGTATDGGVPEATVTFDLARAVEQRLEALGAKVRMTRNTNSDGQWGPCVDARGQFGEARGRAGDGLAARGRVGRARTVGST